MNRVIIEGLRDRTSPINAISVVLDTLNSDDAYTHAEDQSGTALTCELSPDRQLACRYMSRWWSPGLGACRSRVP